MSGPWEKYQDDSGPWSKYQEPKIDWSEVIGRAVKDSFQRPAAYAKDLGTNPVSMANAMPTALGMAGGMSPIPGGATMGTAAGQGLRDLGLGLMKKPIPGLMQHGLELGGAALGDLAAIPAMKKSYYGGQIGKVEKAAGVPPPQDIQSLPMSTGQKSAGDFINDAINSVKGSEGRGTAGYWKSIKDQVDRIYNMGADQKLTGLDKGRLRWLNQQVQEGLNRAVPGRAGPAGALAQSQTIPNFLGKATRDIPSKYKVAAVGGGGIGASFAVGELIKKLIGGQ